MSIPVCLRRPIIPLLAASTLVGAIAGCASQIERYMHPERMAARSDLPENAMVDDTAAELTQVAKRAYEYHVQSLRNQAKDPVFRFFVPANVSPDDPPEVVRAIVRENKWRVFRNGAGDLERELYIAVIVRHRGKCMLIYENVRQVCTGETASECLGWGYPGTGWPFTPTHAEDDRVVPCDKVGDLERQAAGAWPPS